ncbi:MAG: efflux RND transporter periplasmic adaptor subunit [Deltaproteobacteria bacterium]|nr:efflux RND transporter periplasmic adaptor subunit [Deltaproteobacteria bacterium]
MPSGKKGAVRSAAVAVAAAAAAAVALYFVFNGNQKAVEFIGTKGTIEATEVEIAPKISGAVEWLCCNAGDTVTAGQAAVRLESSELKFRVEEASSLVRAAAEAFKEASADLENAKARTLAAGFEMEAAAGEVERVRALANEAKENRSRASSLFKDGYISKKDMDAAQAAYDARGAELSSASARRMSTEAGLDTAKAGVRAAEARVAGAEARNAQAEAALNAAGAVLRDTEIIAPINGRVAYKAYEAGEVVKSGSAVYTVHDLENIWARVDVEETDISRVRLDSPVKITAKGVPDRVFDGRVIEIGPAGGFATQRDVTRGTQDIKTFRVKASVEKNGGLLKPGMTVDVHIYSNKK